MEQVQLVKGQEQAGKEENVLALGQDAELRVEKEGD